jgi:hypothetical protein
MKKALFFLSIIAVTPFLVWGQNTRNPGNTSQPCNLSVSIDSIVVRPCFRLNGNGSVNGGSCGCSNTLWAVVNGGTAPYTYTWTTSNGVSYGNLDTLHGACYEVWIVKVQDSNACLDSASLNVVIPSTDTSSSTAGITKHNGTSSLKLYPVPANNQLNVNLGVVANNTHIEIYDMLGKKLAEQFVIDGATSLTLDLSMFAAGNYFLKVVGNNGQKTVKFSVDK